MAVGSAGPKPSKPVVLGVLPAEKDGLAGAKEYEVAGASGLESSKPAADPVGTELGPMLEAEG